MKFILILIILFVSCSNKIIYENKLQENEIKALEIAILDAKKSSYVFKDWTKIYVFFGNWEEYVIHEPSNKKYKNQKTYYCINDMDYFWRKYKKFLHNKNNKFYHIKIETECIDGIYTSMPIRSFGADTYILFINKNYDIVYRESEKSMCETNL